MDFVIAAWKLIRATVPKEISPLFNRFVSELRSNIKNERFVPQTEIFVCYKRETSCFRHKTHPDSIQLHTHVWVNVQRQTNVLKVLHQYSQFTFNLHIIYLRTLWKCNYNAVYQRNKQTLRMHMSLGPLTEKDATWDSPQRFVGHFEIWWSSLNEMKRWSHLRLPQN